MIFCEMVQKSSQKQAANSEPKRRGRPRAYDPEKALRQVIEAFWKAGYSGTSLDDLSAATGMNRPSLYAAFGDKRALYLKALNHYFQIGRVVMAKALEPNRRLCEALMQIYEEALSIYFSEPGPPRGCFAIGTATAEAVEDIEIRAALAGGLSEIDGALQKRIRLAKEAGELPAGADPATLAMLASAMLHSIAIRARAGERRADLEEMARKAVRMICGRGVKDA